MSPMDDSAWAFDWLEKLQAEPDEAARRDLLEAARRERPGAFPRLLLMWRQMNRAQDSNDLMARANTLLKCSSSA